MTCSLPQKQALWNSLPSMASEGMCMSTEALKEEDERGECVTRRLLSDFQTWRITVSLLWGLLLTCVCFPFPSCRGT